ncbi:MAG TPA: hypothetical protein VGP33_13945 [Chloroflexota bacterium]|jgi:hypothetical protein|nr:hypothetical protein [Chloroflexota bacterium]
MPNRQPVLVRRYAYYEEVIFQGGPHLREDGALPARRGRGGLLPLAGRAALAVGVALLPLLAARLAGPAARRSIGPAVRQALPPPASPH